MAGAVELARLRLRQQAIADPRFATPAVVRWFGATPTPWFMRPPFVRIRP